MTPTATNNYSGDSGDRSHRLDDQLQDTIYQFEHADGVVGRINHKEGNGSKSEKLAAALESSQPIIIVTIQTFPRVKSD